MVALNQVEWRGITMGSGTPYVIRRVYGLGMPEMRTSDAPRPLDHGARHGVDLLGPRRFGLELDAADEDLDVLVGAMVGAVGQTDWLRIWLRGWEQPRRMQVRPRVLDPELHGGTFDFGGPVEWVAADPRIYADTETLVTFTVAATAPGFTFPLTFPLTFGGGSSGVETLVNAGNFPTLPTVRFQGPATTPRLEHVGRGETLELDGTIASGDFVDVDFADRTVLLGGTASRYEWLAGTFFPLDQGDNEIRYTAASGTGTADMAFRSAWGG